MDYLLASPDCISKNGNNILHQSLVSKFNVVAKGLSEVIGCLVVPFPPHASFRAVFVPCRLRENANPGSGGLL